MNEPRIGTHHLGLKVFLERRSNPSGGYQVFLCIHMKDGSREYYAVKEIETGRPPDAQEYTLVTGETLMVYQEGNGFGTIQRIKIPKPEPAMNFFEGETVMYGRPGSRDLADQVQKWRKEKELELSRGENWGTFS